jgi:hypothetical protein
MNSMIWLTICCRSVTKLSGCCRYRPIQRSSILEKLNYDFVSIICIISVYIYTKDINNMSIYIYMSIYLYIYIYIYNKYRGVLK